MFQITSITRGYDSVAEREADIAALRAEGFDHFMNYCDAQAPIALCYGRTPLAQIKHDWPLRHDDPAARRRITHNLVYARRTYGPQTTLRGGF